MSLNTGCNIGENTGLGRIIKGILADWQLKTGFYEPEAKPLVAIYPRPDLETNSYARHRKAYTGLEYTVPIKVNFGAYPYRYEIITKPISGTITLGQILTTSGDVLVRPANYGLLTWDLPTAGTHTFTIRVYDQEHGRPSDSYVDITWQVVVSLTGHIFVDNSLGNNANDGLTPGTAFETIDGWYKASQLDATYQNYHVHYLAGTYIVDAFDPTNGSLNLDDTKPLVHLSYNGAEVIFDQELARLKTESTSNSCDDMYFGGIKSINQKLQRYANAHSMWVTGVQDRLMWYNCEYASLGKGGGDGWKTSTLYYVDDWVTIGGVSYVCLVEHTSDASTFTTDYTNASVPWLTGREVIGDAWVTSIVYSLGDVVRESLVDYQCIISHTSGDFATDLAANRWLACSNTQVGDDNPGGIFFSAPPSERNYIGFSDISLTGTSDAPLMDLYLCNNVCLEAINVAGATANNGILLKASNKNVCLTAISSGVGNSNIYGTITCIGQTATGPIIQEDIQIRYSTIIAADTPSTYSIITNWFSTEYDDPGDENHWITRNTCFGKVSGLDKSQTVYATKNIAVSDQADPIRTSGTLAVWIKDNNLETTQAGTPLDGSYLLTGTDRTTYLGIRGAEIKAEFI